MDSKILAFTENQVKKDLPEFFPGQTVKVHQKIKEGDKERVQIFEGIVIAIKGDSPTNKTIHVRKVSAGIGVERIFPINSPLIQTIEVVKSGKVKRAKLYYMRKKDQKIKEDERRQAKTEKQVKEIDDRRKKESELKAQREAAKKAEAEKEKTEKKPEETKKEEKKIEETKK